jgi:hypothetical protein
VVDYHCTTRRCATCDWWEGERFAHRGAGRVHTPRHAGAGYCRSPVSWWAERLRQAEWLCCFWQQWSPIREAAAGRTQSGTVILDPSMRRSEYLKPLSPR